MALSRGSICKVHGLKSGPLSQTGSTVHTVIKNYARALQSRPAQLYSELAL